MQLNKVLKRILNKVKEDVKEEFGIDLEIEVIKEIVTIQTETVKWGMANRVTILIPYLGSFIKYKEKNKARIRRSELRTVGINTKKVKKISFKSKG